MRAKAGRQRPRPPDAYTVVAYDPSWPDQFEAIRRHLASPLAGAPATIEHIGSTAIPGCAAKPIVDIDVVVQAAAAVPDVIDRLTRVGYIHRGDLGVPGRDAFDVPYELPYHHLYVVVEGSKPYEDHVILRDFLLRHPDATARYSARKLEVAHLITKESRQAYLEAKGGVVEELLTRAREWRLRQWGEVAVRHAESL